MNTIIEPFKIKVVEKINVTTKEERKKYIKEAFYNPFLLKSSQVMIDLLTDSGTSAMSEKQWSAIMHADESYAGASSWERFYESVKELTGTQYLFPTHQGRAAERIIYSVLGGKGKIFLSNSHFDTTRANIEYSGAEAVDLPCPESDDDESSYPFKGNINITKLEEFLAKYKNRIGGVVMTLTNNTVAGQPVSMENLIASRILTDKFRVPLILDISRIAENSFFIKKREKGYENKNYRQIAQEICSLGDVCIMSLKKDGLVNTGGFLAVKSKGLFENCQQLLIISEGYTTYGGLAGRDLEAIAVGLSEVFEEDYLKYRLRSIEYLGEALKAKGIPVVSPPGGHAVYINAASLYRHIPSNHYPGQALVCELYVVGGIRSCEIGSVMFGKYDKEGVLIPAKKELVRLAIPRRVYTQSHIDYVVEVFDEIKTYSSEVKGFRVISESNALRHFTIKLAKLD